MDVSEDSDWFILDEDKDLTPETSISSSSPTPGSDCVSPNSPVGVTSSNSQTDKQLRESYTCLCSTCLQYSDSSDTEWGSACPEEKLPKLIDIDSALDKSIGSKSDSETEITSNSNSEDSIIPQWDSEEDLPKLVDIDSDSSDSSDSGSDSDIEVLMKHCSSN